MDEKVYLNGRLVSASRASVSVFDRGLTYGDGLFETIKAVDGVPLLLNEHIKRLKSGLKALKISGANINALLKNSGAVIRSLLKTNRLSNGPAYIRVTISRGPDRSGHLPGSAVPTVIVFTKPLDSGRLEQQAKKGIKAVLIKDYAPSLPHIKSLNYLPNVLGRMEAQKKGAAEGIFVSGGIVLEGTSTNVFIVQKGVIKTPTLGKDARKGILPGVTRAAVLKLAKRAGIKVTETKVKEKDLLKCDEAFLTNSIIGALPLIMIEKKAVSNGRPGPVTRRVQELLKSVTG